MAGLERLGLVGPLPPPSGGMANQTKQLAELLREEGIHVELVQVNAPYRPAWIAAIQGIRALFRMLPYARSLWFTCGRVQVLHIMANSGWSWHLFTVPAVWIAAARGVPVVLNYRGGEAETFFRSSFRWVRPTLAKAAVVLVPSGFLKEVFQRFGVATRIVPNIIDIGRFRPRTRQHDAAIAAPHIIVTRNLEPIYDIATAIRAFARLHSINSLARLTVAGSGPELGRLVDLAGELGVAEAVVFTGRLDNEDMAALYQQADIMLNASLADNMPISVLEALASGVPVVSTDVGGVAHLVEHGKTALLVPARDDKAMVDAVVRLLNDTALRASLITAGLKEIAQFTWPKVRERLLAEYNDVLVPEKIT